MHFARGGNSSLRAVGHHTIYLHTTAINGNCYVCMCVCVTINEIYVLYRKKLARNVLF